MQALIRGAAADDALAWAEMRFKLWDTLSIDEHVVDIKRMLGKTKRTGYVALAHEVHVGFAEISIRDYANGCTKQPVPFLEGIWVHPKFRKQGIGLSLVTKIRIDLAAMGFEEICSHAHIKNRRSHHAHRSWGFEETDRVVYFRRSLTKVDEYSF